jgi:hypothetical protein
MELDDQDLSPEEQRLAGQLEKLAFSPSPERRSSIMAAVRTTPLLGRSVIGKWRVALALSVAAAILAVSTVGAVASSGEALPNNPNYSLRLLGEQVRLALAEPTTREHLRIAFAQARIAQVRPALAHGDRSNAKGLLRDSHQYLDQARKDIGNLPRSEQGGIENQLNQAELNEHQAESQLGQDGEQGQ